MRQTPDRKDYEEEEVRAVEARYDRAWSDGDLDGILALLTQDAVLVNPFGDVARGRDAIRAELSRFFARGAKGTAHASSISRVEFVRDDVAVVDGTATITTTSDGSLALGHGFTDVLVKGDGGWLLSQVRAYPSAT